MFNAFERIQAKKKVKAKKFLVETILYGLFLVLFGVVTYNYRSSWAYNLSMNIKNTYLNARSPDNPDGKNFFSLAVHQDFFDWASQTFFPTYAPSTLYNGKPMSDDLKRFTSWYNYKIGAVRFRQLRVKPNIGCRFPAQLTDKIKLCYPTYAEGVEQTEPFGPPDDPYRYRFSTSEELCTGRTLPKFCYAVVFGQRSDNRYSANGYVVDFDPTKGDECLDTLKRLQVDNWINAATRAVIIDFNLFNPTMNNVVATQLIVKFYATGNIRVTASVKPMPLLTLEKPSQILEFIGEIVLIVWIGAYIVREIIEFHAFYSVKKNQCTTCVKQRIVKEGVDRVANCRECHREFNPFAHTNCPSCQRELEIKHECFKGYFQDSWNLLDVINMVLFIVVFVIRIRLRVDMMGYDYKIASNEFFLFFPLAWQYTYAEYLNSFNALLCFFKAFKYLGRVKALSTLVKTLSAARRELASFFLIFAVIFIGFSMCFHMAFGDDVESYRHWMDAMMTLFAMLLGDFNYADLQESNRVLAPIFFFSFILLVFFVLANMFIAIVSGAYEEAVEHVKSGRDDFLSSSLKLFFRDRKLQFWKLFKKMEHNQLKVQTLLTNILKVKSLTETQKDDIRTLRRELDHEENNAGLLALILATFHQEFDRTMSEDDYELLKSTIIEYKKLRVVEKYREKVFEEDDYDEIVNKEEEEEDGEQDLNASKASGRSPSAPGSPKRGSQEMKLMLESVESVRYGATLDITIPGKLSGRHPSTSLSPRALSSRGSHIGAERAAKTPRAVMHDLSSRNEDLVDKVNSLLHELECYVAPN